MSKTIIEEILKEKPMSPSEFRKAMESAAALNNKPLDDFAMAIAYALVAELQKTPSHEPKEPKHD